MTTDNVSKTQHRDFLIVDPDENALSEMTSFIQNLDNSLPKTTRSGREAREILKKHAIKFVIAELEMPYMSGIELLQLIRRQPELFEIPVLLVSQEKNDNRILNALEERADGFLLKPFDEKTLRDTIYAIQGEKENLSPLQKELNTLRKLQLTQEYDKAILLAHKILANTDDPDAMYTLSKCYFRQKKYEQAKRYLQKLLEKKSNCKILHLLGKVCRADNQCGDALVHLSKANIQNPLNTDLKIDLGKLNLSFGMGKEAKKIFEDILQGKPTDLNLIKIGKAYLKYGELEEAGKYLNKTRNPIPETAYVFEVYAEKLAEKGRYLESLKQYEKCLRIVPEHTAFLFNISRMHVHLNNLDKAREILQSILKMQPGNIKAQNILTALTEH